MNRLTKGIACLPAVGLIAGFVLGPLLLIARISLCAPPRGTGFFAADTWTNENFLALLDSSELRVTGVTLALGLTIGILVPLTAFPLALFVRSLPRRWRPLALALILFPKTAGLLAVLFGLQRWLPRGFAGATAAELFLIAPYATLAMWVQLRAHDPTLLEAARGLGASRTRAFFRITLPLSLPGLNLAFQLGLIWGLGAFLGPLFLGTPTETTLCLESHRQAFEYGNWPRAAALALELLLLLAVSFGLTWLARKFSAPKETR